MFGTLSDEHSLTISFLGFQRGGWASYGINLGTIFCCPYLCRCLYTATSEVGDLGGGGGAGPPHEEETLLFIILVVIFPLPQFFITYPSSNLKTKKSIL
jgi:hypothetical protein